MGDYLYMSFIIRTFVLSVVNTEDGFDKHLGVAEGRLQPALYKIKSLPTISRKLESMLCSVELILIFTVTKDPD